MPWTWSRLRWPFRTRSQGWMAGFPADGSSESGIAAGRLRHNGLSDHVCVRRRQSLVVSHDGEQHLSGFGGCCTSTKSSGYQSTHGMTYFRMMSFVLDLIMDLSSVMSNCQPFSSDDFHKLISAPRDSGTEYNC